MRIISKHKDYYDNMIAYGIDPNVVFNRNDPFEIKKHPFPKTNYTTLWDETKKQLSIKKFFIFAAGKVYKAYYREYLQVGGFQVFHSADEIELFMKENGLNGGRWRDEKYLLKPLNFVAMDATPEQLDWAKEHGIVLGHTCGTLNPKNPVQSLDDNFVANHSFLKALKFYNRVDGVTLFNDLSMWISLLYQKDMVTLDNGERIVKAGFDKKISFRNPIK